MAIDHPHLISEPCDTMDCTSVGKAQDRIEIEAVPRHL